MTWWNRNPIQRPAECPACLCDVAVHVLVAKRKAGAREERAGVVCECVRCATRYTVLDADGRVIRYGGAHGVAAARVGTDSAAVNGRAGTNPGGAGDGAGASLFADMETLD